MLTKSIKGNVNVIRKTWQHRIITVLIFVRIFQNGVIHFQVSALYTLPNEVAFSYAMCPGLSAAKDHGFLHGSTWEGEKYV